MKINLQIAERKGLKFREGGIDYTKDPALILELELELLEAGWELWKYADMFWWRKVEIRIIKKDFGTATTMAWLEEFK